MNKTTAIKLRDMRSPCPIANTLDILGDKRTLLVIRDLFSGKKTYTDFQSSPESIPTNILANRLKRLADYGIIEKTPYQQRPVRYAYRLTEKKPLTGTGTESNGGVGQEKYFGYRGENKDGFAVKVVG